MKKFFAIIVSAMLLALCFAVSAGAAEYVYYENDFSDASTLSDFTQYRGEWGIVDGKLMLVGLGDLEFDDQGWIIYSKDEGIMNLTDYILEVDMICLSTQAGPIFRSDINNLYPDTNSGFSGYQGFVSFKATQGVIGRSDTIGNWAGNLVFSEEIMGPGSNIRMKIIADGTNLSNIITDLDTGAELWYGETESDEFAYGTFGFRACVMKDGLTNLSVLGFDNLKVTAINEVGDHLAAGKALKDYTPKVVSATALIEHTTAMEITEPEVVEVKASTLDMTKTEYVFYENDFSDPATINDFRQYRGKWVVRDGGLYYEETTTGFDATGNFSFILYSANTDANLLRNYTVEVEIHNSQSSAGPISRADLTKASSESNNSFYGYHPYVSSKGDQTAVGYGKDDGGWGGLLGSGEVGILAPNSSYRMKIETIDDTVNVYFYNVGEEEPIWSMTKEVSHCDAGSFGFRQTTSKDLLVNLAYTYFDNLKVTVHGDEAILLNAGYHPNATIVMDVDAPVATTAPEATQDVVATTNDPLATVDPDASVAPETTADPDASVAPETTDAPEATDAPDATDAPEATDAPDATDAPEVTTAPATTAPAEGGAPVALIIGIVAAVVVIAAIVAVVLKKKKN